MLLDLFYLGTRGEVGNFQSVSRALFDIYATLVFVLRQLMPSQGDLAVAGSALAAAALANPMRHRLQRAFDLRFNRTHADAARTLSVFTTTLRTPSDLKGSRSGTARRCGADVPT